MSGGPYDPAIVAALTDTITFELRAQLALRNQVAASALEDEIEGIAFNIADQVLVEWCVTPRPNFPAAGSPP